MLAKHKTAWASNLDEANAIGNWLIVPVKMSHWALAPVFVFNAKRSRKREAFIKTGAIARRLMVRSSPANSLFQAVVCQLLLVLGKLRPESLIP